MAHPLQRASAVADVRLLQADQDGRGGHGRVADAISDRPGGLHSGGSRVFDGEGRPLRSRGWRPSYGASEQRLADFGPGRRRAPRSCGIDEATADSRDHRGRAGADSGRPGRLRAGRVCALRRTEEAIRLAHARIRREASPEGRQVQPATLELAQYVILFTTVPERDWADGAVLGWYRTRWQVELVFKRFKSLAQLWAACRSTTTTAPRLGCTASWWQRCWRRRSTSGKRFRQNWQRTLALASLSLLSTLEWNPE